MKFGWSVTRRQSWDSWDIVHRVEAAFSGLRGLPTHLALAPPALSIFDKISEKDDNVRRVHNEHYLHLEAKMTILIGARDLRQRLAEILGKVGFGGDVAVVERSGKPMAAIIPIEMYRQLIAEREARFAVIREIQENAPDLPEDKIEAIVAETIRKVREQNETGGS
jgi:prevent-host-death family protein